MKNIKLIRVTKDITQLNVKMKTGISQSALSKYESGESFPSAENLIVLARFYGTSTDYLLDLTDEMKPYPPKR